MASPTVFAVDGLLDPIPGENPAGRPAPFALWNTLEAARKEFQPHPEDPSLPPIPKSADWAGVVKLAREALTQTSKDLGLGIRLCEALLKIHGYAGLRDGFRLLHALVTECWDRVFPAPDTEYGEGMEVRAAPFEWIADPEKGGLFPLSVRGVPTFLLGSQPVTVHDYQSAIRGQGGAVPADDLGKLVLAGPAVADDLEECAAAFDALDTALAERMGNDAPGLTAVRQALEDCRAAVKRYTIATAEPAPTADGAPAANGTAAAAAGGALVASAGSIASRQDAYRLIGQVADVLERLEPHSPIPYLLRRAVELGNMPFHRLLRELVRHDDTVSDIEREFGIKREEE